MLNKTCCKAVSLMKLNQRHALFSTLLAVLVAVGLSLSAVQSSTMDIMMSMSADMDDMSSKGCGGCPGGGDDSASGCSSTCMVTAFATLPAIIGMERITPSERFDVFAAMPRDGPRSSEPTPPKHHNFS